MIATELLQNIGLAHLPGSLKDERLVVWPVFPVYLKLVLDILCLRLQGVSPKAFRRPKADRAITMIRLVTYRT